MNSGFNLKERKLLIYAYSLLPDESFITYNKLFSILKNVYKFEPKIFTLDFCKASANAIKENYPNCIIIKCYFHWI